MMKNKTTKKTLIMMLSILICALFIGTSVTTAVARIAIDQPVDIADIKIKIRENIEIDDISMPTPNVATAPEKTTAALEKPAETTQIDDKEEPQVITIKLLEKPKAAPTTADDPQTPDEPVAAALEKPATKAEVTQARSSAKTVEVVSQAQPTAAATATLEKTATKTVIKASKASVEASDCAFCAEIDRIEDKDVSLADVLTDEQAMEVATIFMIAAEAAPVMDSYQELSSKQKELVREISISKLDEYVGTTEDESLKKDLLTLKALSLGDNSEAVALQKQVSKVANKNDLVRADAMVMPHASAPKVTTSSSPCINGKRSATSEEFNECQAVAWAKIGKGIGRTAGYAASIAGHGLSAVGKLTRAGARAILSGISQLDNPVLFGLAIVLIYGDDIAAAASSAIIGIQALIAAGLLVVPEALGFLILGGMALNSAIKAFCQWRSCDDGGYTFTGSSSNLMRATQTSTSVKSLTNSASDNNAASSEKTSSASATATATTTSLTTQPNI